MYLESPSHVPLITFLFTAYHDQLFTDWLWTLYIGLSAGVLQFLIVILSILNWTPHYMLSWVASSCSLQSQCADISLKHFFRLCRCYTNHFYCKRKNVPKAIHYLLQGIFEQYFYILFPLLFSITWPSHTTRISLVAVCVCVSVHTWSIQLHRNHLTPT